MAWSDREWVLAGAAVRISIIAFDDGSEAERVLNGRPVTVIHADLTSENAVIDAIRLQENEQICFLGIMKGGPFDISHSLAQRMLNAPRNPNGLDNSEVVKSRLGARDVTARNRHGYIIDFGDMQLSQAALFEMPFEYVKQHVKPIRDHSRDERIHRLWWLHGRTRPALRRAINSMSRCIVTPEVSKYRLFVWMDTSDSPDHKLHVFARDDAYFLGVLHSRTHVTWSLTVGSTLEDRPSYNSDTTFETFPFPWSPGKEPQDDPRVQAIAAAAKNLVDLRDRWLNPPDTHESELKKRTLTNLYNARPQWLDDAHRALDRAVFAAYGWSDDLTDQQILEKLLAVNHERAAAQDPDPKSKPAKPRKAPSKISAPPSQS